MSQDHDYLVQQIDATAETYAELFAAVDAGTHYDDGSGCPQDPHAALSQAVIEVYPLRALRLLLSTGGPRVTAEATIERDGTLSGHRITASTPWDDVARHVHPGSGVGRLLEQHAEVVAPEGGEGQRSWPRNPM